MQLAETGDKEEGMKEKRGVSWLMIAVNMIGAACLVYFAVPYLTHNTGIAVPDAMLPVEAWDRAGMILTFGFIPLFIANILGFLFAGAERKYIKFLFFIPSVLCLMIVISYWVTSLL